MENEKVKIHTRGLNFFYGNHQALFSNNLDILEKRVTAIIGPSGCGKSTYLRCLNRIFELYREQRVEGKIMIDGKMPVNPSGGVIAANPIGATAMVRTAEAAKQVRGNAGPHQIPGPVNHALASSFGGTMWTVLTMLEKELDW